MFHLRIVLYILGSRAGVLDDGQRRHRLPGNEIMEKTERALTRRKMMLITGGAIAGAGALIAAPFREEIADHRPPGAGEHALGRGLRLARQRRL